MPLYTEYCCSECKKDFTQYPDPQSMLVAKVATFRTLGSKPRVVRSRTTDFMCESCMKMDKDFNLPAHSSPGMKSASRERVRSAERMDSATPSE